MLETAIFQLEISISGIKYRFYKNKEDNEENINNIAINTRIFTRFMS